MGSILKGIIGNRKVADMTTTEAKSVVAEFYMELELRMFSLPNYKQAKVYNRANRVLNKYGLGFFA